MSAVDRFAAFVEVVTASLTDEKNNRAEGLAKRLFLSRAQCDRIVRTAAGETPASFQRRVLLERAAYRLRTTRVTILTAATEAGYASHEAFTRAFQRAYGDSPARWRRRSASFQIEAPNGVHFYPPAGLRLPATSNGAPIMFVSSLVDHHVDQLHQIVNRAAELTDKQRNATLSVVEPSIDPQPTIHAIVARLVGQLDMWLAAMASVPYDVDAEADQTLPAIRARLDQVGPAFTTYVRELEQRNAFDETFVDATGEQPYVFTAAGMVAHILTYAAYRRTVLISALAALGQDIDDDPLAWFRP